ncbi:MAG: SEL1-like repeat protein [Bacteroidales bacterium]|nr:SEL1-like repeat protein [Bacteroidales bacterium]
MDNREKYYTAIIGHEKAVIAQNGLLGCSVGAHECAEIIGHCKECFSAEAETFASLSAQNDADAMFFSAYCFYNGYGVAADRAHAIELYTKAADLGNSAAQYFLALEYVRGADSAKNIADALALLNKSAEQGYLPAQMRLGFYYTNSCVDITDYPTGEYIHSGEKLISKSLNLFTLAAEQGNEIAQWVLGHHYEICGELEKSTEYYRKSAEQNNTIALYQLARHYQNAIGTEVNIGRAIFNYKRVLEFDPDNTDTICALFLINYNLKRYSKAIDFVRRITDNKPVSSLPAEVSVKYGLMCAKSLGREMNARSAIQYIANGIEAYPDAEAVVILAQFFMKEGKEILDILSPSQVNRMMQLFEIQAENNDLKMQYILATLYRRGEVVHKDKPKAKNWYQRSANEGYALSQYALDNINKSFFTKFFGLW